MAPMTDPAEPAPDRRLADPPRRPVLFVNPRSGGGAAGRARLAQRARERGIEAIELGAGQRLDDLVAAAIDDGADAVGAAGGDGSLATVAAVACAHDVPLVCIPAGTRNHFARDLGADLRDLAAGLDAFAAGVERRVDVGEVNGRVFLNNVSLGVYGEAVGHPGYRDAKVRTLLETAEEVLGPGGEASGLRVVDDLGAEHRAPALVLASNNPYAVNRPGARGMRPVLDGGRLGIIVLDPPARSPRHRGRAWTAPALVVDGDRDVIHAGLDGEAADLRPPLRIAIRPAALRVRFRPPA
jgi:diacylglycerol kinase-like protein